MNAALGSVSTPSEFVRSLPDRDKDALLAALLQEAIAVTGGRGIIPVSTPTGQSLGYYVPPGVKEPRRIAVPEQSTEDRRRVQVALDNLDDAFDPLEELERLSTDLAGSR